MLLSKITVKDFSQAQLISFCNEICMDSDYPVEIHSIADIKKEFKYRLSSSREKDFPLDRVYGYLSKHYPEAHYFQGDKYIPCINAFEELGLSFKEFKCPILGQSVKFYPSLKRIVYVDPCLYAEDYDVNPNYHPTTKRLSLAEYNQLLIDYKSKIQEIENILN